MSFTSKIKSPEADELFQAVLMLQNLDECYRFFDDICSMKELHAIIQRFQVAKLLQDKKTYNQIEASTGASTATISRVNRSLVYGADGYRLILDRMARSKVSE